MRKVLRRSPPWRADDTMLEIYINPVFCLVFLADIST